ncbi:MAG: TonB-dependent receptor, partial [Bryobacterales bacterium]|nr:TonB-dependent receptor [Bryobacterales bacterium]
YANSGVVNFVTRSPEDGPTFDLTAEGGSLGERRFSLTGSDLFHGFGIAGSSSRRDFNGPVVNSDYENTNVFLSLSRKWRRQSLTVHGDYDTNNTGEPGAYGSNPAHIFTGLDTISRSRNYFSDYLAHYQAEVTDRVRQEVFASFFLNNSPYQSAFGTSFNKDIRAEAEERTTIAVTRYYTTALGFTYEREEDKNTYISDASSRKFPLRRDQQGMYWENRLQLWGRLFLNAGLRQEVFEQAPIPAEAASPYYATRPNLPHQTYLKTNPKLSAAYLFPEGTRLHASFGTGIRPPGGSDLAFTNNPGLKPEKTVAGDVGVDQRLLHDRLSIGATYFRNRFSDQIVALGGNLSLLGSFQTGNLSRTKSDGAEFTAEWRPARWFSAAGNYTYLDTAILSLKGSDTLVQKYYTLGQQLPRRPKHSGSLVATFQYRSWSADVTGYLRGETLDIEPNFGASAGFYRNPGYQNIGLNLNYRVGRGLTVYGNLRNALNQRYEEIYGYPSPILNFVAGAKWSLPRGGR